MTRKSESSVAPFKWKKRGKALLFVASSHAKPQLLRPPLRMTRNTECFLEAIIKLKDKTKSQLHLLRRLEGSLSCFVPQHDKEEIVFICAVCKWKKSGKTLLFVASSYAKPQLLRASA
jgi:hypothetical protein